MRKRKCPSVTARKIEIGLETTILFSLFFLTKKGVCGRLVFVKRVKRRDLWILSYHYGFNIMHSVEFSK